MRGDRTMNITEAIKDRRTVYAINKELPVSEEEVVSFINEATALVPDAFNMKSQRVVVALGDKQDQLWDTVYDVFEGKVPRDKIDGFKAGAGTVLYFYDKATVEALQDQFPLYADNFPVWAQQSNGMLQFTIWAGLRNLGIGANLQHYNPVIDEAVKKLFDVPENYVLVAEMPFGGITELPAEKEKEDISLRVKVVK